MRNLLCCLALAWAFSVAAEDIDKVNGSIRIEDGRQVGKLSTVNGSIQVGADCTVASAETVNGQISLGERTRAGTLETVNGAIELEQDASAAGIETVNGSIALATGVRVKGDLEAVNGTISLQPSAQVSGDIETVNGRIALQRAVVIGQISTVSGDIDVGADSRVGSIHVDKENFSFFGRSKRKPRIVIEPGATVQGALTFDREVELFVSDRAKIGRVEGAKAQRFQGERP
jgi:DUF4097 and DUF4098 domain-containing protein YvlB